MEQIKVCYYNQYHMQPFYQNPLKAKKYKKEMKRPAVLLLPVRNISAANHGCQIGHWIESNTCFVKVWVLTN